MNSTALPTQHPDELSCFVHCHEGIPVVATSRREGSPLLHWWLPNTFRFLTPAFVPGVVSLSLSPAFAIPAAYGDLVAAILQAATLALACASLGHPDGVGVQCGTLDLRTQTTIGRSAGMTPGSLGRFSFLHLSSRPYSFCMDSFFGGYCGQSSEATLERPSRTPVATKTAAATL
jgi:hypothetical protein